MKKLITSLFLVVLVSSLLFTTTAFALDPVPATVYGTITAINTDGTLQVTGSDGTLYTVTLPIGVDPATLTLGSLVKLDGTIDELGVFTTATVQFNQRTEGYYCSQSSDPQPAGSKFAEQYGADYLSVQWMFCNDGMGFGEIRNMLRFSLAAGVDTATLQAARESGLGWGQIFKQYDVPKGNPNKPAQASTNQGQGNHGQSSNGNHGQGNNGHANGNGNGNGNKP